MLKLLHLKDKLEFPCFTNLKGCPVLGDNLLCFVRVFARLNCSRRSGGYDTVRQTVKFYRLKPIVFYTIEFKVHFITNHAIAFYTIERIKKRLDTLFPGQ